MNRVSRWLVAILTKIVDGFLEHIGDAIAVAVAVFLELYWAVKLQTRRLSRF